MQRYQIIICFTILIGVFVAISIPELTRPIEHPWEVEYIQGSIENCEKYGEPFQRAVIKFYQFCLSDQLFGNHKIITFIESIGVLILAYLITVQHTKKPYTGLIASTVLAGSHTFFGNAATGYFSTEWVFLLLLAIWVIPKRPEISGVFYSLSLFAKGITLLYYPFLIWMVLTMPISRNKKILGVVSLSAVIPLTIFWTVYVGDNILQTGIDISYQDNLEGALYNPIWNFVYEKQDYVYLFGLIPLALLGLYSMRKELRMAIPLFGFVVYMFSMQIWIPLFSEYGMGDYRNVAMMAFVAVSLGILSNHRKQEFVQGCKRYLTRKALIVFMSIDAGLMIAWAVILFFRL